MKILVTGATGQLGQCFQKQAALFPELEFIFVDSSSFDLSLFAVVSTFFRENKVDVCINCAAYTNVEQAEVKRELAYLVNSDGVKNLAEVCEEYVTTLVHFSTDYVFDGRKYGAYSEEDETNPINIYGASKLSGEECIQEAMDKYFIFRTSWLYSDLGHNFYNTIRRKAEQGESLKITSAQKGTPTNAYDLALFVLQLIAEKRTDYGLYHYSNKEEGTWYDFAKEILTLTGQLDTVELEENNDFRTLAARPENSVLSKEKTIRTFQQEILPWKESLKKLVESNLTGLEDL